MTNSYSNFQISTEDSISTVLIDRPEKRNAMGKEFFENLPVVMKELSGDSNTRVVIIAANGFHFSVGLDLTSLADIGGSSLTGDGQTSRASQAKSLLKEVYRLQEAISSVEECPKPVIAVTHGYCIGGGLDLITAADIRVASKDSIFSLRETKMAMVADLGSLARLPFIIGSGSVAELAFTGKDVDAFRAKEIGLINHLRDSKEEALSKAKEIATEIASNSPLAVEGTKTILNLVKRQSIEESLKNVALFNSGHLMSNDLTEAVMAFFEKRKPNFSGS